ncbi:MAG: DUF892 family protein [Verrucomicrobiaceae bacterium]|nr:MAG: DUF892 family protein [Verrucomicrobiaceae bacterium]
MKNRTASDFFLDCVSELHRAEACLADALPDLAARASHPPLYGVIAAYVMRSPRQLELFSSLLRRHGAGRRECGSTVMESLITGGNAGLDRVRTPQTRDLLIAAHCSRMGRYGMAGCGFALRLARSLNLPRESLVLDCILAGKVASSRSLEALEPVLFELAEQGGTRPVKTIFRQQPPSVGLGCIP